MKKTITFLGIIIIGLVLGFVLKKNNVFSKFSFKAKIEVLGNSLKDFGVLKKGQEANIYFKYKNIGRENLTITNIDTRCGCTISEWRKTPLKRGEIDSIFVEYDTNILGPFSRTIAIYTNGKNNLEYVHIRGIVKE